MALGTMEIATWADGPPRCARAMEMTLKAVTKSAETQRIVLRPDVTGGVCHAGYGSIEYISFRTAIERQQY